MSNQNPHEKRSSSMSFALRWKHENVRRITYLALFTLVVTTMFFMLLSGTQTKSVALVVNGEEQVVKTKHQTVKQLLDEQDVKVGEYDRISLALDTKLKHGDRIAIERARTIELTADGKVQTLHTVEKTLDAALTEFHITVDQDDRITPAIGTPLTENNQVEIVRVTKEKKEIEVPIAFETTTKQDATLLKGKQQTLQEGKAGKKIVTKEQVYENGVMVKESVLGETVAAQSVKKIVAVGTKNPVVVMAVKTEKKVTAAAKTEKAKALTVTKGGVPISYKKLLNNVTLTAYSAGVESTGKNPGDSGYGITRTGTKVTEGRTISVDPNVIPLGWWVYIEGVGYRRAEDTGSAVKGNKIDVYYDSESYAQQFGLKRGYTVYVIGPKKPSVE
ncbi:ubiquitin-like domain-containing protein [Gorillibacterium timonense]|uniref:ubiquitin-like domain-containing protein n=1 Tax=Gorillibacterium timonense TaxID=1689269 RepID=UPI00292A474D|nr:ubiquitin-like domain-containing protein [Gorillibacterium timonense]